MVLQSLFFILNAETISDNSVEPTQIEIQALQKLNQQLPTLLNTKKVAEALPQLIHEVLAVQRVLWLAHDIHDATLEYCSSAPSILSKPMLFIKTFNPSPESLMAKLVSGDIVSLNLAPTEPLDTSFAPLAQTLTYEGVMFVVPICTETQLVGCFVIIPADEQVLSIESLKASLQGVAPTLATIWVHSQAQTKLQKKLTDTELEMEIFRRLDAELSDTIELDYVFRMIMDWALRFTNADAAGLVLYDSEQDRLRMMANYGYRDSALERDEEIPIESSGIAARVARSGQAEIVPDVTMDKDYFSVADGIRTQLTVPIMREEKVIAVLALESRKFNGFNDDHLEFVRKLTNRAGVAVDNARLFTETRREREKLSHIVRNIADIVIVVSPDNRILLMNHSAVLAFQLSADSNYSGQLFTEVISDAGVQRLFRDAAENNESTNGELELPNGKFYFSYISRHSGIGYIIVMQDITHYKETDKLKTELIATVSHDLKQPLSVMRGYLDLLRMIHKFDDDRSKRYIENLEYAFGNMRQLIDDLLDIAYIESGLQLDIEDVDVRHIIKRCVTLYQQKALDKSLDLQVNLPESTPTVRGDEQRLQQIFNNLITNAIKYTPPNGEVRIFAEVRQDTVRFNVSDDGMGIGPEDQAQIFERFYRVRRPETDSIEGTGLGLAIVKSLIEAHRGKIDLQSELGVGSTFRVTLPTQ